MLLSVAHGANNARSSVGVFTMMLALHQSGVITETVQIQFKWRVVHAVGMTLGTLFLGFRLAPVAGELLVSSFFSSWQVFSNQSPAFPQIQVQRQLSLHAMPVLFD